MTKEKRDINLEELFRQKLEKAEIEPDLSVKSKLMKQVTRKEFLHFNPGRFNIYYLGGLISAGIIATILIPGIPFNNNNAGISEKSVTVRTDTIAYFKIPEDKTSVLPVKVKQDTNIGKTAKSGNRIKNETNDSNFVIKEKRPIETYDKISVDSGIRTNKIGLLIQLKDSSDRLRKEPLPDFSMIEPVLSEGCAPFKIKFYNRIVSCDSCKWIFGDGGSSVEKNPEWIFDMEGDYKVMLTVFMANGKTLTASANVIVHQKPKAYFEVSPAKTVMPNDEIHFLNYSINASQFRWDFGDGTSSEFFEPRHRYSRFGNYKIRLIAYSDYGCADSVSVSNAFSESEYYISFPNAFIPDKQGPTGGYYSSKSDETAMVFHPSSSGVVDYHLKIFSKLAILIFESNDINIGWDGYNKGQLCEPGVYIWKVRGSFRNGETFTKMGDVTLLKQ